MIKDFFKIISTILGYCLLLTGLFCGVIMEIICLSYSVVTFGAGVIHLSVGKFFLGLGLCAFHWVPALLFFCIVVTVAALFLMLGECKNES